MTTRYDTADDTTREEGLGAAALAIRRGELVVVPTDTVYGVGCDAFDAAAVTRLFEAKARGRDMPAPVLVSAVTTLDALTTGIPDWTRVLVDRFWPGPLTVVCAAQSSLQWDIGDARGTVAVRMPEHEITLELIDRTGPMAVSSANTSGQPPATNADQAIEMLGDDVAVVLDAGETPSAQPSTIVDCTGDRPHILREGALSARDIYGALEDNGHAFDADDAGYVNTDADTGADADTDTDTDTDADAATNETDDTQDEAADEAGDIDPTERADDVDATDEKEDGQPLA